MKEMFLLKLGEIVLKGANRRTFEETLKKNVRRTVSHFGAFKVYIMQSTVYVEPQADDCDLDGAWEACGHVFGVSSMCRCRACEKNLDAIYQAVVDYLGDELCAEELQGRVQALGQVLPAQLHPDLAGDRRQARRGVSAGRGGRSHANLCCERRGARLRSLHPRPGSPGAGGLPTGTGGRAAVLLSGGIDSPVAGYMIAKRGVELECIHFFLLSIYLRTREGKGAGAGEAHDALLRPDDGRCGRLHGNQEAIRDHCREEYFTIIMRRFMMRISEAIARDHGAKCLVTGENLGQVASQTMDAMAVTGAVVHMPIFHPLIGMDKEEIVTIARKIGTLDTSILPYEDCCTVFTPKHPKTKPSSDRSRRRRPSSTLRA